MSQLVSNIDHLPTEQRARLIDQEEAKPEDVLYANQSGGATSIASTPETGETRAEVTYFYVKPQADGDQNAGRTRFVRIGGRWLVDLSEEGRCPSD